MLTQPRHSASVVQRRDLPEDPGVYAWFRGGECVYLGKASNLRSSLGTHLGTSLDLSRSTLRSWVAVRELHLAREYMRRRPTVMTNEQVAIVTQWIRSCDFTWIISASGAEAATLEAKLLAAWRPGINVAQDRSHRPLRNALAHERQVVARSFERVSVYSHPRVRCDSSDQGSRGILRSKSRS